MTTLVIIAAATIIIALAVRAYVKKDEEQMPRDTKGDTNFGGGGTPGGKIHKTK